MSKKLFIFYFLFMFVSIGLFTIENGVTGSENKKDVQKPKKTYKHYVQYGNLC